MSLKNRVPHKRSLARRSKFPIPTAVPTADRFTDIWPALLLFGSGAASLVYQLLWIKQLSLVVGVEVYAVTIAVSAFFAGLAIGGAWMGRLADRVQRPWRLYACLEGAAGLLAISATLLLAHSAALFAGLEQQVGVLAWLLPFLLVGLPAVAMGGTLPVLVRAHTDASVARTGGRLYAANTAGAITGTLLAPFILLPAWGITGTALFTASVYIVVAIAAMAIDRKRAPLPVEKSPQINADNSRARLALILYAVAGGVALGYEVVWSQTVVQFMSTRAFAFAMMLAVYLFGLMLGSAIYTRFADRVRNGWAAFGILIASAGLVALLQVSWLGGWLEQSQAALSTWMMALTGSELVAMCGRFVLASASLVLVPTLLLGAAFPAVLRLCASPEQRGRGVGFALALNTAGGILGTMLTGFVLVPTLGLIHTLALLALIATLIGVLAIFVGSPTPHRSRWVVLALGLGVIALGVLTPSNKLAQLLTQNKGGEITYYQESRGGTVAVLAQGREGNRFHRLYIQGVSNSGDTLPSLRYMRLQALLPLIIHQGEPKSALVIGFGTGITAGALSQYPGLTTRVVAELLPAVVHAASQFQGNYHAGSDPGLQIRLRDGRRELLRNDERYDMITLEPPPPSAAGVVNLYSQDFYALAASRLNRNGIVAQWWPIATQNNEDSRAMVRAFLEVFPHATLWTTELHEMLLVGSMQPMELDGPTIEKRFKQPSVARSLSEVGIPSPGALLGTWVAGREQLERYAGNTPAVTDDHPSIEYSTWVRHDEILRVLPELMTLQTRPEVHGASPLLLADMGWQHDVLFTFYAAGLAAYAGDRDSWARAMEQVMRADGDNAYYRWVVGGSK